MGVTPGEVDDWPRRRTLERPPLDERWRENRADVKASGKEQTEDMNTIKHWVKYSDSNAGPSVYRELADDLEDEVFDVERHEVTTPISRDYQQHLDRPSDRVVHVHHVLHEVHDEGLSAVDAGTATATATVELDDDDDELASAFTQRTSSGDEKQTSNNERSREYNALAYNVEEGTSTTTSGVQPASVS